MSEQEQVVEQEVVAPPSIEEQAREMGWKPLEEFNGPKEKWVDPTIFVARAPLFKKIDEDSHEKKQLKNRLQNVEKALNDLNSHHQRVKEMEYSRALASLKAERKAAIANDDHLKAEEILEQIDIVKEQQAKQPAPPKINVEQEVPQEFVNWIKENDWYEKDVDMKEAADAFGIILANKGIPRDQVLVKVSERIRTTFPDKFRNPMKDKVAAVETQTTGVAQKGKISSFKPTQEEREIAKRFASTGIMTENEYYEQLKELHDKEKS